MAVRLLLETPRRGGRCRLRRDDEQEQVARISLPQTDLLRAHAWGVRHRLSDQCCARSDHEQALSRCAPVLSGARGLFAWPLAGAGFQQVPHDVIKKSTSSSTYTFGKLASLFVHGILSFSIRPLGAIAVVGLVTSSPRSSSPACLSCKVSSSAKVFQAGRQS